ncbi:MULTISPECIES: hypothetical protein [unclassified Nocardia]|uniref:hypothetical protein n=1 Tax=unclassified Nocardia TaxID=2637762 RepID=UPI001CE4656F|nr:MULTISPECIES: hypothetical protein [unclassified Nocardia]
MNNPHFIGFYNSYYGKCLDGGNGIYGADGGCSTSNNWQIWNIYTNRTSEPYHGG